MQYQQGLLLNRQITPTAKKVQWTVKIKDNFCLRL